jgi:hypothetical protein
MAEAEPQNPNQAGRHPTARRAAITPVVIVILITLPCSKLGEKIGRDLGGEVGGWIGWGIAGALAIAICAVVVRLLEQRRQANS